MLSTSVADSDPNGSEIKMVPLDPDLLRGADSGSGFIGYNVNKILREKKIRFVQKMS